MPAMPLGRLAPAFSAAGVRGKGRPGLRGACLAVMTGLAIQLILGMILNLYVTIPAADAQASYLRQVETAPETLAAHAGTGLLLLAAAGLLLLRAIALRDPAVITLAAAGLAAIAGAFASGEAFVRNGADSASLSMAVLTGAALLCYAGLQMVISRQCPPAREGGVGHHAGLADWGRADDRVGLPAAGAGDDASFGDDRLEAHVGKAGVAQRPLPESRCGRVLMADAEPVPGQAPGDPPPAGRSPDGQRRRFLAEYLTVASARAAAEHHVGDHDAAPGTQPPRRLGGEHSLVLVGEVVQRVAGHDQVGALIRQAEGPQVGHLCPDVPQPVLLGALGEGCRHGGRDVDREHGIDQGGKRHRHEPGARAEVHAGVGGPGARDG